MITFQMWVFTEMNGLIDPADIKMDDCYRSVMANHLQGSRWVELGRTCSTMYHQIMHHQR